MSKPTKTQEEKIKAIADKLSNMPYDNSEQRNTYHIALAEFFNKLELQTMVIIPYGKDLVHLRKNFYDAAKYIERTEGVIDFLPGRRLKQDKDSYGNTVFYTDLVIVDTNERAEA